VTEKKTRLPREAKARKILVVDDEPDVTTLIAYHLRAEAYQVEVLNDPLRVIEHVRANPPDLVILDVMMPDLDGIHLSRMLRSDEVGQSVAVMFLSARSEEADRIRGLENGAEDYICKPFSPKELLLRVSSVLRRIGRSDQDESARIQHAGRISLNPDRHLVSVDGRKVELTATEFKLLHLLMARKGRVQARDHLLLNVWNYATEIETRTIDTHIRRLREKLGSEASLLETVRGVGYRIVDAKPEA
jgi:two-component system, OmpR family, phosphate regulon response regulator PhoB